VHTDAPGHSLNERRIVSQQHSAVPLIHQTVHCGNGLKLDM
jgi:hypothetical protein